MFWIVLSLIALALSMTLPSFRNIPAPKTSALQDSHKEIYAILLAVGTGMPLNGLGRISDWVGIALALSFQWGIFTGVMLALSLQLCFVILSLLASLRIATEARDVPQSSLNQTGSSNAQAYL
ncbi:hypothetical protein LQV63_18190 [Paenibacillus profundus]|uniref:Uncharacterized protein n=1 Tax=Paenibacillus profundus TaxID=1173085 RepID=A0ABS8YLQ5_9BACL|nr:hypothetical protein [Paenibacillus profundus]MCE5171232.1 hypothetical protein [Paenibacillus profundus]